MGDVELGMRLARQMRSMDELIDEYKGKELTPHRHHKLIARYRSVSNLFCEALRKKESDDGD